MPQIPLYPDSTIPISNYKLADVVVITEEVLDKTSVEVDELPEFNRDDKLADVVVVTEEVPDMDDKIDLADDGSNQVVDMAVASESQDNVGMVYVSNGTENVTESQPLTPTQSEVLIHGIATIEKSPFNVLAQEQLESIFRFITSKDHMKKISQTLNSAICHREIREVECLRIA